MEPLIGRSSRRARRRPTGSEEAWLSALLRASGEPLVAVDKDGIVRALSAGARRLYGDAEGRPAAELRPPPPSREGLFNPAAEADTAKLRQELDSFVYGASHDLQEPLRKIAAFGELLERRAGSSLDPQARDFLKRMRDGAGRMGQLIQDLLLLSRAGRDPSRLEEVELEPLVREAGLSVGLDFELGPLPSVRGRPKELREVFVQLLSNAAKFRGEEPARVKVTGRTREDGLAEIEVTDQGIGFSPDQTERIFQPFVRLHPRQDYPGSGVGLTLARKLLAANGGSITARGEPGKGATFTVALPAATASRSSRPG